MTSSPTITLFTEQIDPSRRPATLLASAVIHVAVIALVSFGILYAPVSTRVVTDQYTVRQLDLHTPQQQMARAAEGTPNAAAQQVAQALGSAGRPAPSAALHLTVQAKPGAQTLLQPDLAVRLAQQEEIPVPQVLIWSPRIAVTRKIVAPNPEQPTAAEAKPSLDAPNQEVNVADVAIASSQLAKQKLKIMPSTTTPLVVRGINMVELPPSTLSQVAAQPTPTALLSLSDLRMNNGTAVLPPINETAKSSAPGTLQTAAERNTGAEGSGGSAGKGQGSGAGKPADAPSSAVAPSAAPPGQPNGTAAGPAEGANSGTGQGDDQPAATEITLPKNGQFGAVVVGDSIQDEFPEMSGVWSGRMAYTVYLHVGLARSWILQYSLPRDADAGAAGMVERLEAPWPYNIVRPNLAPGAINADALMVHGFVNQAGRFEALSMVFPQNFPQAQFVLKSLAQWQFRPASHNGQVAKVEVLLIIPEELD